MNKNLLCLVLDNSFMPRSIITTERGFTVVYKGNAEIVESYDDVFKTVNKNLSFKKPSVIKLNRYLNLEYKDVPLSRNNIFKRDDFRCVYCGYDNVKNLTIDHVIPTSKGGKNKWDNVVTACKSCNSEKADLDIEEWGKTDPKPKRPHYLMMMRKVKRKIPDNWKKYLFI